VSGELDGVHAEGPVNFGNERYFAGHDPQIPVNSTTWRRSR
jgi:hypothetical protein